MRGALGLGLIWGLSWGVVAVAIAVLERAGHVADNPAWLPFFISGLITSFEVASILGILCGALFSLFLAMRPGEGRVQSLSRGVVALCGALAGAALYLAMISLGIMSLPAVGALSSALAGAAFFGVLGAASSAGTLSVARRAPGLPNETDSDLLSS